MDTASIMLDKKINELGKQSKNFIDTLSAQQKQLDMFKEDRVAILAAIEKINNNIKYIKTKAKVATLSRWRRAQENLKEKQKELLHIEDIIKKYDANIKTLNEAIVIVSKQLETLNTEKTKIGKVYEFRK